MRKCKLVQSKTEGITPHGGLALIGQCINQMTSLHKTSRDVAKRHGVANIDLIRMYVGVICSGKSVLKRLSKRVMIPTSMPPWVSNNHFHPLD